MPNRPDPSQQIHLLSQLVLPARFEVLRARVGDEVARLLVAPEAATSRVFEQAARTIQARGEGLVAPLYARSGTGKTTLASNLSAFFPSLFTPTLTYEGEVTFDELRLAAKRELDSLPPSDQRVLPINIDHRESNPPNSSELAALKRFLRTSAIGTRSLVLWPETNDGIAVEIARALEQIVGSSPIPLPLHVSGPPHEAWQQITISTLEVVNSLSGLEELGVDPRNYRPEDHRSIGEFMATVSADFAGLVSKLIEATQQPLRLVIVFVSRSTDAGVLSQLTSSSHYGLVDPKALLDATSTSVIGRWWRERPGLLTQTVLRLDAHAFCLPPTAAVAILARYGSPEITADLSGLGVGNRGPARIARDIARSDFGKFLVGAQPSIFEARGAPASTATAAFQLLSERGFVYGSDKKLNQSLREALADYCATEIFF